jgi:hypothetical protein
MVIFTPGQRYLEDIARARIRQRCSLKRVEAFKKLLAYMYLLLEGICSKLRLIRRRTMTRTTSIALLTVLLAFAPTFAQNQQNSPVRKPARVSAGHEPLEDFKIEFARGTYRLKQDSTAYVRPSLRSKALKAVHRGSLINVTGATLDFAQVRLSTGETGYIPIYALELFRSTERNYILTSNSRVYARPNLASQPLAEVHQNHNVHVIGVELNYLKIKMHSGLEGYIPVSSVE